MATTLRFLTIIAAILLAVLILTPTLHARPQSSASDETLLNAANVSGSDFRVAFFPNFCKLTTMNFTSYSSWRFTCCIRMRGASV